jgi:hypothetical protein
LANDILSDAGPGDIVHFKTASSLRARGATAIQKDASATGSIVDGAKHKIFGIGGKMTFRLETVDAVDGSKIALRATPAANRNGIAKHPLNPGAKKAKEIASAAGTEYVGYIDSPQNVMVKK